MSTHLGNAFIYKADEIQAVIMNLLKNVVVFSGGIFALN